MLLSVIKYLKQLSIVAIFFILVGCSTVSSKEKAWSAELLRPLPRIENLTRVAVLPFTDSPRAEAGYSGNVLASMLVQHLLGNNRYVLVERERILEIMREKNLSMRDLTDQTVAQNVGRLAGAQVVITGAVSEYRTVDIPLFLGVFMISLDKYKVGCSLRMVDANTGNIIFATSRRAVSFDGYEVAAGKLFAPLAKAWIPQLNAMVSEQPKQQVIVSSPKTSLRPISTNKGIEILGEKYALLIGIDQYMDVDIVPLTYAEKDIQAVRDILVSSAGYQQKNVFVMRSNDPSAKNRPTRNNVLLTLKWLSTNLRPEDSLLVLYCGHGDSVNGENYLIPMDGQKALLEDTAIRFSRVFEWLDQCSAGSQIICLDACHSGGLARNQRGSRGMQAVATSMGKELEKYSASGRAVLTSCSRDEISYEDNDLQHGVFSYYLIDALSSAQADSNGDKSVTVYELGHYVRSKVAAWCKEQRKIPAQTPRLRFNDLSGEITLLRIK